MAAPSPIRPKTPGCKEKQRLVDAFIAAARELMNLQSRQMAAVASAQEGFLSDFDAPLQDARRKKDDAMRAYARHLEEHGC
ncbi:MAG TPA: hypothetical protein VL135_07715 [Terracidiphilus sp.]|jgi:hypothetical protein|nr:hypothetical protein [Terracidiphilus sp.]